MVIAGIAARKHLKTGNKKDGHQGKFWRASAWWNGRDTKQEEGISDAFNIFVFGETMKEAEH